MPTANRSQSIPALHSRRTSADPHLVNTFKHCADANMFAKRNSQPFQHISLPRPDNSTVFFRDHREGSGKKTNIPQSLYYTNGYMPKLADIRDALRANKVFHNRYNPALDDPKLRAYYKDAIKKTKEEEK